MACIVIHQDQQPNRTIHLYKDRLVIGRSSECEIHIPAKGISRKHARLFKEDGAYFIEDLSSKNGVLFNGQKVGRQRLEQGDRVTLDKFILEFFAECEGTRASASTTAVEARNVGKEYRLGNQTVNALNDISLRILKGEFVALSGPSGSGKSTLLNLIGCIDLPTSGSVLIDGEDMSGKTADELADIRLNKLGFVFQTFNLLPVLTAWENIEYPLLHKPGLDKTARQSTVALALEMVGLERFMHHRPDELSGGQRQRVAIARALATRPEIVLADEPTANLDHRTGSEILKLMRKLNHSENVTFIFSTHDPRVLEMADRVIELSDGQLVEQEAE